MRLLTKLLFIASLAVVGCTTSDGSQNTTMDVASARREASNLTGETVRIEGYLSYAFEDKNLYESKKFDQDYDQKHCVSIGHRGDAEADLKASDERYVTVEGVLTDQFCPKDTICSASCSEIGIFVERVVPKGE